MHTIMTPVGTNAQGMANAEAATGWAVQTERRRAGRAQAVSPALIALMRQPTRADQVRLAIYDAPGFLLPSPSAARRPRPGALRLRMLLACLAAAAGWGLLFKLMCVAWG